MSLILSVSLISCLADGIVLAQPIALEQQQSDILTRLNSNLSPYDFWGLMMIESWLVDQGPQSEVIYILREQFNRANGGPIKIESSEDFRRLYDRVVSTPCNYIKSTYENNKDVFETPTDTLQYDEISLYKDIAHVCENLLLNKSKQDEFLQQMLGE